MTRTIAIVASLLAFTACAPRVIDSYCLNAKPITYSASGDTAETKAQIKEHNAAYSAVCR